MKIRCPHCQIPIEVVSDDLQHDITCPSCDSSFSLIDDLTATAMLTPETKIGRFELIDQIGAGAFGAVWMARDPDLDRTVAVKIPRREQFSGKRAEWFLREARAAAQLKHPNIVSVHEVGKQDETLYIVSDYISGVTLSDWLTAKRLHIANPPGCA